MKLSCDIVGDLLPLYEEGLCSPGSRQAVEEHLESCGECQEKRRLMAELPSVEEPPETKREDRAAVKLCLTFRRRLCLCAAAVLLLIPLSILGIHQIFGYGVCFTNADDILLARKYITALANEDYERILGLMDWGDYYQDADTDLSLEEFVQRAGAGYLSDLNAIAEREITVREACVTDQIFYSPVWESWMMHCQIEGYSDTGESISCSADVYTRDGKIVMVSAVGMSRFEELINLLGYSNDDVNEWIE